MVLLDIDSGLFIGIILNLLLLVYRSYKNQVSEVAPVADTGLVAEVSDCEFAFRPQEATVLRLKGVLSFANFESTLVMVSKKIRHLPEQDREVRKTKKELINRTFRAKSALIVYLCPPKNEIISITRVEKEAVILSSFSMRFLPACSQLATH